MTNVRSVARYRRKRSGTGFLLLFIAPFIACAWPLAAIAQDDPARGAPPTAPADTTDLRVDSLRPPPPLRPQPAAPAPGGSRLEHPVELAATDSLVISFGEAGGDRGSLYGSATATYGEANLQAHRLDYLFDLEEVRAQGLPADTGLVGRPQFMQGGETFYGERLAFNLGTERGRVVGAETAIEDGFVQGEVVKVTEDSTLYILGGRYTTCDCPPGETPSYSLRSSRMKIVDQKWVYTGPIRLYIFNIPTPIWLPFGFLPAQDGRRSGPLPPNYGEDEYGFFLRDWGWYWAINDYTDAQLRAGLWTKGSWSVAPSFRYARRYRYTGQLGVDYGRFRMGERADPDFSRNRTLSVRWTHNQTISPTANLSGNVNLSSTGYLRAVSERYDDRVTQQISSSINFSKSWRTSGRSLRMSASQQQSLSDGSASLTLPNLTFSQGRRRLFGLFAGDGPSGGGEPWYEKFTYSYSGSLDNRYRYDRATFNELLNAGLDSTAAQARLDEIQEIEWYEALVSPAKYRRATLGETPFLFSARHSLPISASFNINRIPLLDRQVRLNVSTNANYTEEWFIETTTVREDSTGRLVRETQPDFFRLERVSTGGSVSSTFYGLFPFRIGRLNGFRHRVNPSLSFTYQPDLSTPFWGNVDTYYSPRDSAFVPYLRSTGNPIGSSLAEQRTFSFSLNNDLETKLVRTDSTGEVQERKLKLLDFDFSTSYNAAADSFRLQDITFNARTAIDPGQHARFGRIDLSLRTSWSPYAVDAEGDLVDRWVARPETGGFWQTTSRVLTGRLARLMRLNLSVGTSLQSRNGGRQQNTSAPAAGTPFDDGRSSLGPDLAFDAASPDPGDPFYNDAYADFSIPWSLSLDGSYSLSRRFDDPSRFNRTATLNGSFRFSLTPKWQAQGRSGYDFIAHEFVLTNLSLFRDFECWEMSFTWVPFGPFQSYSFNLQVKSGKLAQLLRLSQPSSGVRDRFSGIGSGGF